MNITDLLPVNPDPKDCRRRADECERMAKEKARDSERDVMLMMAKHWRAMANAVEKAADESAPKA